MTAPIPRPERTLTEREAVTDLERPAELLYVGLRTVVPVGGNRDHFDVSLREIRRHFGEPGKKRLGELAMASAIDDDHLTAANPVESETGEQSTRFRFFAHLGDPDAPSGVRTRLVHHDHATAKPYLELGW